MSQGMRQRVQQIFMVLLILGVASLVFGELITATTKRIQLSRADTALQVECDAYDASFTAKRAGPPNPECAPYRQHQAMVLTAEQQRAAEAKLAAVQSDRAARVVYNARAHQSATVQVLFGGIPQQIVLGPNRTVKIGYDDVRGLKGEKTSEGDLTATVEYRELGRSGTLNPGWTRGTLDQALSGKLYLREIRNISGQSITFTVDINEEAWG